MTKKELLSNVMSQLENTDLTKKEVETVFDAVISTMKTTLANEEKIQLIDEMYWFFKQSKDLEVTFSQKSIEILLNKILARKNDEVIEICEIVAEIRSLMSEVEKEMMAKPQKMIL